MSTTTPLKDAVNKFRVLFLDVFEELDGQPACSRAEQVLRRFGCPEEVGRTAWSTAFRVGRDQPCRSQRNKVLTFALSSDPRGESRCSPSRGIVAKYVVAAGRGCRHPDERELRRQRTRALPD